MNIPKTMRAAILAELNQPLVIDEVELPSALEVGQVLVKIGVSGICGSQIGEIDGAKGEDKYLPHLLGHEASGVVHEVGPGVRFVKPGDNVVLHWRKSQGIEAVPPRYTWRGKQLNAGLIATFNEYAVVSENRVTRIDPGRDMEVAALFGCAVTTGFGVVENNADIKLGESVVIFGAGGVGLNIVQAANLRAAYPIIAVDQFEGRLDLARQMGATHVINAAKVDAKAELITLTGKRGIDVFIDNTGQPAIIEMGYELTHAQGRVVLVGVPRKGRNINIYSLPLHFDKTISGSHGGEAVPHLDIPRYTRLLDTGRIQLKSLITEHYRLDEINTAIARMRDGRLSGRCMILMDR
ncbi:Alcohol dehydrogenase superfamily, zinc-containing:Alcohol dehydrogenase, zinc-containing [Herbaspirillum sp. GW103]|jgi:Zn-dependent alcohol dehydrogenase|uniref:zinc-binding dehydrogenase n=1 Tax=Herbaspirillum sp. GW103 TaxID=1175306 RepID=UPI00025E2A8A|nr:zinc-binding dehydrogenase [Herbaspirillum sp. GW103]EIJ48593.1 Alcohol dehydrogenase superfamily, zinc-containing:Alcohol dehydrogenase, zinc-containing [Herbaspirillum sp. GW103]